MKIVDVNDFRPYLEYDARPSDRIFRSTDGNMWARKGSLGTLAYLIELYLEDHPNIEQRVKDQMDRFIDHVNSDAFKKKKLTEASDIQMAFDILDELGLPTTELRSQLSSWRS